MNSIKSTRGKQKRSGFTLVELLISSTVVAVLFAAISQSSIAASRAYDESMVRSRLVTKAHQVLDRIADEFVEAELDSITPAAVGVGASSITYRVPDSFVGSVITWSADRTLSFQLEAGEVDDGIDNNGDGRVDEAVVLLTIDDGLATEKQVRLVHDVRSYLAGEISNFGDDNGNLMVDERGLVFELDGTVLTIRLTLEALDEGGRLITKTVQSSVRIRN